MAAISRYIRDGFRSDGKGLQTPGAISAIRFAIRRGDVAINDTFTTTQADRLDTIAGKIYGNGRYWWILAIASDIGWGLQVPPGTIINVPDLRAIERLVG